MIYSDNEYELLSNTEIDMLLVDLPFELIKENLRYQINNPLASNVNYVESVIEKFEILRTNYSDNEDIVQQVNSMITNFFGFLIQEIDTKFELSVDMEMTDIDEYIRFGTALYNFLILRYKKNITKFIYRYIVKNKKTLVEAFESSYKKKDVTSIAVKKTIKSKNKDDVLILSNLPNIIKYIMNLDVDPADFLRYASKDENYEASVIQQMIATGRLAGNFVGPYLQLIVNEYDTVLDEVQTDIRMKLMSKL